jgi:FkbM family methyltransferase
MVDSFRTVQRRGIVWQRVRTFPDDIWCSGLDLGPVSVAKQTQVTIRGIVQVGANLGQELTAFPDVPTLLLEPHPEVYPKLLAKTRRKERIVAKEVAAADRVGKVEFYLTRDHQQSSLLKSRIGTTAGTRSVQVEAVTLDELLTEDPRSEEYNVLLVDTQGAEDKVLAGAVRSLPNFDIVILEMSYGYELYHQNADGWRLETKMSEAGFELVAADPIEWIPVLLKDGEGWLPSTQWFLRNHPRLLALAYHQIFGKFKNEKPLVSRAVLGLTTVFRGGRAAGEKNLRRFLSHIERLGYRLGQCHTNVAFVKRDVLRSER